MNQAYRCDYFMTPFYRRWRSFMARSYKMSITSMHSTTFVKLFRSVMILRRWWWGNRRCYYIHLLWPIKAIKYLIICSLLVYVMTCRLINVRSLHESIITYCQWNPETNLAYILIKIHHFCGTNSRTIFHLENKDQFYASICFINAIVK